MASLQRSPRVVNADRRSGCSSQHRVAELQQGRNRGGEMTMIARGVAGVTAAMLLAVAVQPARADEKPPTTAAIGKMAACRAIADDAARLACFDREVGAFDIAVRERRIAVVDQAEIRKTRRTLFGIALPSIKLFDNSGEPEIKELTATIKSTRQGEGGRIVFTLEDGAVWAQTDDFPVFYSVKAGQKVTLKRGALSSFFADFEKAVTVRAKRLR
ncbi:hypothetical protein [Sphingomonas sp. PB4P5]|uniref:hypothetical protein n=1 Tax=Parasphingomonas puruogangriensis TaxID=3096155 RepID=UPI002FCBFFE7